MGRLTIAEHICDNICKYQTNVTDQAQLEDICNKCEINDYLCKMQLMDCTGCIHKGNKSFCLNCKRGGCRDYFLTE
ncbi:MAG: hypothetical protein RR705_07925 [Lachnospiraceae bacterium]